MTQYTAEEMREVRVLVDQAVRENVYDLRKAKARNDEIVRQHVVNKIPTKVIADLLGMSNYQIRSILRVRGYAIGTRPFRFQSGRLSVPAAVRRSFGDEVKFTCEITGEGILYRVKREAA